MARKATEIRYVHLKTPLEALHALVSAMAKKRGIEDVVLTADADRVGELMFYVQLAERLLGRRLEYVRRMVLLVQTGKALKVKSEREKEVEAVMGASAEDLVRLLLSRSYEVRESL